MIKLIAGPKGAGKTKTLLEMVNRAVNSESGSVVCIEKGAKLTYDVSHKARLIEMDQYDVKDYDAFFGFISGIVASNYDITTVFIDSIGKIAGNDFDRCADFFERAEAFANKSKFDMIVTLSAEIEALPDRLRAYIDGKAQ